MHPSNREEKVPPIYRVPVEVLLLILGQLCNIKDLNALSQSCKAFHNYIARYGANSTGGLHLHEAIDAGNKQLFILLVWRGVDLNERNRYGYTALHRLVTMAFYRFYRQPTIISALIKRGADPNAIDAEGKTPLHHASFSGPDGSVNALLAHSDTNRNARCAILGWTPLHYAVYNWTVEAIRALLTDPTVDPGIGDIAGRTPLHLMYQNHLQFTPADKELRRMMETVPGNSAALDLLGLAAHQYSLPQNRALNEDTFGVFINDIVRRHCQDRRSAAIYSLLSRVRDMQTSASSCLDLRMPLSSADATEMHPS